MDTTITSVELAKKYFVSMGCSHFHMAREYPERYDEYRGMEIPKDTEQQWKKEIFQQLYNKLMLEGNKGEVSRSHSYMEELVHSINTDAAYDKMLIATKQTLKVTPDGDRIVVAETIIGRQENIYRSGLIYHSFDRGRRDHAKEFAELSILLAKSDNKPESLALIGRSEERIERAISTCKSIQKELGLQ
jgi:hypothetical protein